MKKALKILKILLLFLFGLPLLYLLLAVIGFLIPVNSNEETQDRQHTVFLVSNGVHVDIAVPVKSEIMDWTSLVEPDHVRAKIHNFRYLSLGWGDLGFYRTTPEWDDLTPDTAFKALFLPSPAAIHATYYRDLWEDDQTISLQLDDNQFRRLTTYLLNSFSIPEDGDVKSVEGLHYGETDAFYPAPGSFSLFKTCNTWANNGLKYAGLEASLWTPFEEGIFYRYQ